MYRVSQIIYRVSQIIYRVSRNLSSPCTAQRAELIKKYKSARMKNSHFFRNTTFANAAQSQNLEDHPCTQCKIYIAKWKVQGVKF